MMPAFCISCSEMVKRWQELVSPRGSAEADLWIGLENWLHVLSLELPSATAIKKEKGFSSFKSSRLSWF